MIKYTLKRFLIGMLTVFFLITLVFFLMKILPGGPFDSERVTDDKVIRILEEKYNLDKPIGVQYVLYLKNVAVGDLGESFKKIGTTVTSIIVKLSPITMKLGVVSFFLSIILGVGLGIISALTKKKWLQSLIIAISTAGISIPGFLLALFFIYFFALQLNLLPIIGLSTWKHYIMPSLALSFFPIAYISRLIRSSLSEVMLQDFVIMARSKGVTRNTVIVKHAMKNAIIPTVTYMGPMIAYLMTGSFIVETIFAIPGIGREFVYSISGRDYPVILGLTIFIGTFIVLMNFIVDIIIAFIDPRIKLE
ncbi:ABC transporter permease [Sporosarcina sp. SAFN-015]|uniref:ABC transporter permease n=1 Tax=Sporosarcina sp. SAFN-015 TaxID=3387274 RepID=UPI003F7FE179